MADRCRPGVGRHRQGEVPYQLGQWCPVRRKRPARPADSDLPVGREATGSEADDARSGEVTNWRRPRLVARGDPNEPAALAQIRQALADLPRVPSCWPSGSARSTPSCGSVGRSSCCAVPPRSGRPGLSNGYAQNFEEVASQQTRLRTVLRTRCTGSAIDHHRWKQRHGDVPR